MEFPEVIELNVGGRHMSTLLSTLTKYPHSMLAAMFSGRHHVTKDKDGRFFIDADGDLFSHLLNFLRFETMPPYDKANQVKLYAEKFGIQDLQARLNEIALPTQDEMFTTWTSNIPGYYESLSFVKEKIMYWNIDDGFIILSVRVGDYCERCFSLKNCLSPCDGKKYLLPDHLQGVSYQVLQVPAKCDVTKRGMALLTLLSLDLKQYGLVTEPKTLRSCCYFARIFRLM